MIDFFSKKLSLRENLRRGYQISPAGDGEATIHNPNSGATYTIAGFECDCPDKTKRNGSHDGHISSWEEVKASSASNEEGV